MTWLSVKEAAAELGLDESTIYRLCRSRKIPHRRMGAGAGRIVFTPQDLSEYLEACRVPVEAATPEPESMPFQYRFIRPQGSRRA